MTADDTTPASPLREADIRDRIDTLTTAVVSMNAQLATLKARAEAEGNLSSPEYLDRRRSIIGALGWKSSQLAELKAMQRAKERRTNEAIRAIAASGYDPEDCISLMGALVLLVRDLYADSGQEWAHEDLVLLDDVKVYIGRMTSRSNSLASNAAGAS